MKKYVKIEGITHKRRKMTRQKNRPLVFWSKPGNLEAEVWAEFGMHQYENIEIALEMFQTLFPNLYKSATIKLKELK